MADTIHVPETVQDKKTRYEMLLPQIEALVGGETDLTANLANIAAALKSAMGFFWIGFYLVRDNELVLGPFQGSVACTRIAFGKGVCGTAWKDQRVIVVDDVEQFPGHIACSALSKSEIVLPAFRNGEVFLVMDADSDRPADFDNADAEYLGRIIKIIEHL
jgi:GAF domain-containing protein